MKIDIGCGGTAKRCAKGYDVYTDVFIPKEPMAAKFVLCPMESMPFKDKEFDYARCHHVIEHTEDPAKACSELVRIAKAGIISFPPPQAELMFGRKEHKWFVFVDRGRLLFVKKRHPAYGIPRKQTGCELNVNFEWKDSFKWVVVS
jgi:ubiquinone/menaquinone biosynthesis C-methylase UbiE